MASFSEFQRTTVEQVISIPAAEPWGACWNEVYNCLNKACNDFLKYYGRDPADDDISVRVTDSTIEIIYKTGAK